MNETDNFNSTLSSCNDITFQDVITTFLLWKFYYFIKLISFIIFIKNKPKLLFSTHI